jgi:hypothetical protein
VSLVKLFLHQSLGLAYLLSFVPFLLPDYFLFFCLLIFEAKARIFSPGEEESGESRHFIFRKTSVLSKSVVTV